MNGIFVFKRYHCLWRFILVALATLAATTAFAQSSVTISGQLDAGIQSQELRNGAHADTVGTGIHGASRLRFVGVEDLGGGTKANFWLEMQPSFQNGSTNANLFNRGAWLGLQGNWGEVRLGRQGTNTIGAVCTIDQHGCYSGFSGGGILFTGQSGPGTSGGGLMLANSTRGGTQAASTDGDSTRYIKSARYSLPTLVTGLSVNATYAFGSQGNGTTAQGGSTTGVDATYANGPLAVVFAYQKADADSGATAKGELTTIGGTYDLGMVKLGAGIQQEKASGAGVLFTKGDSFALTATVPMGAFTPYIKYGEHKYSGGTNTVNGTIYNGTNAKVANIGVRYALSKRSLVYVDYVQNGASLVDALSIKQQGSVGIQHNF
jgi:predicted porin